MTRNQLSEKVIGLCIEIHRTLGPGLLESAYEECLCYELSKAELKFERQKPIPVKYKEVNLDCGYRIDVLVEDSLLIELKSVERVLPIHEAQILTYMKLSDIRLGLLINFNVTLLTKGIKRFVNNFND
ncbi:MAG: GxxExxY protein [Ignavibacteriales bacterium]|nr:GxxExxY protein [Ignavibacteriales bacterium]